MRDRLIFTGQLLFTLLVAAFLVVAACCGAGHSEAQDFYKGKRLTILVGYATGGSYDLIVSMTWSLGSQTDTAVVATRGLVHHVHPS